MQLKLAGLAEVAEILGVSQRTAARYVKRPDFPTPIAHLRATPVWLEDDLRDWTRHKPKHARGRPLKAKPRDAPS